MTTVTVEGTEEVKKKPKKNRVGNAEAIVLVIFAIIFDLLSLIPFVNIVIMIIAQGLIALFFYIHGVSVVSKKRTVVYVLGTIIEAIPAISIIPAITAETIIMIVLTRIEDKTGIDTSPSVKPGSVASKVVAK